MEIRSLTLGRGAAPIPPDDGGASLSIPNPPAHGDGECVVLVHGCCKVPRTAFERLDALRAVFVTTVSAQNQVPQMASLLGDRLVFDEDVDQNGGAWVGSFRFELAMPETAGLYFLHVAVGPWVSNVVRVDARPPRR